MLRPLLLTIALLPHLLARAEVIDRVAVSVERQVIAESEVLRQVRITAFLNGEKPAFTPAVKRATADRLVEQALIRREIEATRYVPPPEDKAGGYDSFRKTRYPDVSAYNRALAEAGITDEEVRQAFEWQALLLEFINVRFRPGIQIDESEIREHYQQVLVPEAKSKGEAIPSLEDARDSVEEILLSQRIDNALDRWLGQTRTQTRIRYRREVFQ